MTTGPDDLVHRQATAGEIEDVAPDRHLPDKAASAPDAANTGEDIESDRQEAEAATVEQIEAELVDDDATAAAEPIAQSAAGQSAPFWRKTWIMIAAGALAIVAGVAVLVHFWSAGDQAWEDCKTRMPRTPEQRIADCGAVILAAEKPPTAMAQAYRIRARSFFAVGEFTLSINDYSEALKTTATDAHLWSERGVARMRNGQPEQAASDFAHAMSLDPALIEPVIGRGRSYMAMKDPARAAAYYTLAISMKPDVPEPVYLRAQANVRLERIADAAADYDRALELAPTNANYWNARCWFRATMSIDLDLAISDCDQALRIKPDFAPAMDSRAFVLLRLGRLEDALAAYNAAIAAETRYAWPYFGRGIVKRRLGDEAGAASDFETAQSLQTDIAEQYAAYGESP